MPGGWGHVAPRRAAGLLAGRASGETGRSTKATRVLWDVALGASENVVLIFGRETGGLPADLHEWYHDRFVGMPIASPRVRSLNLSTSVAVAVYEVLRQRRGHAKD